MRVRSAEAADFPRILELARSLDLDYPGMEADRLWVAEEGGEIAGIVALKDHPDCQELCALGVAPKHRGRGIAKALVEAVCKAAAGDVHLGTVISGFFEGCGFSSTSDVPRTFVKKRATPWCEGCDTSACRVMVRKRS